MANKIMHKLLTKRDLENKLKHEIKMHHTTEEDAQGHRKYADFKTGSICGSARLRNPTKLTKDWSKVTCKRCLMCHPNFKNITKI